LSALKKTGNKKDCHQKAGDEIVGTEKSCPILNSSDWLEKTFQNANFLCKCKPSNFLSKALPSLSPKSITQLRTVLVHFFPVAFTKRQQNQFFNLVAKVVSR